MNNIKKINVFFTLLSGIIIASIVCYFFNQQNYSILLFTIICSFILYIAIVISTKESPSFLLVLMIFTVLLGTFSTYMIPIIIKSTPYFDRLLPTGSVGDWIGYAGSIIGGMLTMLAVYFTIKNEKTIRTREEELKMLPYIEVGVYNSTSFSLERPINVTNACSYPIRNLKVTTEIFINDNKKDIKYEAIYPNFLSVDSKWPMSYSDNLVEFISGIDSAKIRIIFLFEFENLIQSKKYNHEAKLETEYLNGFYYNTNIENLFRI